MKTPEMLRMLRKSNFERPTPGAYVVVTDARMFPYTHNGEANPSVHLRAGTVVLVTPLVSQYSIAINTDAFAVCIVNGRLYEISNAEFWSSDSYVVGSRRPPHLKRLDE
jgi:hypothetical protein